MLRSMFSRRWWWSTLIVIIGIALAIRLGIWQLDRHSERQASISHIQAMQALPIVNLDLHPIPIDLNTMEYRQVIASGEYDFESQVALRNQVRSRMSGTDPGFALVTPLLLGGGQAVLVERGWIPLDYNTPAAWREFDEPGTVYVEGIIRLSLNQGEMGRALLDPTLTSSQTRLDFWNFMDLTRLQEQIPYSILDVYIQQAPGDDTETLPYRLMEQPNLDPGSHIGFALQWFFYAGLLLFGYPVWLKKQKKKTLPTSREG